MHIFGELVHIFGELAHIFGELVHIFARKLVSRTSKQVSKNLGPLWQPGVYNDTNIRGEWGGGSVYFEAPLREDVYMPPSSVRQDNAPL